MRKGCSLDALWNKFVRQHAPSRKKMRALNGRDKEAARAASAGDVGTEPAPAPAAVPPGPRALKAGRSAEDRGSRGRPSARAKRESSVIAAAMAPRSSNAR